MFVYSFNVDSAEVCFAVTCYEWKHTDLIKILLENQDDHQNCHQNNVYYENDLYVCSMCTVFSSFDC